MASRDKYALETKCPECGADGTVRVSENEGWAFAKGDHGFRVDSTPEGLTLLVTGNHTGKRSRFRCQCGHEFEPW